MLQGRNFATKIWNAFRLIQGWKKEDKPANEADLANDRMVRKSNEQNHCRNQ